MFFDRSENNVLIFFVSAFRMTRYRSERICRFFTIRRFKMPNLVFTPAVAQSLEIAHALLANRLHAWFDTRLDLYGHCFESIWGRSYDQETGTFFKKRISSFSMTLQGVRITEVVPVSIPIQEIDEGASRFDPQMEMGFLFHLGTEEEPSRIILRIILSPMDGEERSCVHRLWGAWEPSYLRVVSCIRHPDPQYEGPVLGLDVLDEK